MERIVNVDILGLTHFQKQALYLYAQQVGARTIKDTNRELWRVSELEILVSKYFADGRGQYKRSARYVAISRIRDFLYGQKVEPKATKQEAELIAERITNKLRTIEKHVDRLLAELFEKGVQE